MEKINDNLKKAYESKIIRGIIVGFVIAIIAMLIFQAGEFVGFKRAEFSFRMGNNYYNNFDGSRSGGMMGRGFGPGMFGGDLTDSHGAAGKIIKIDLPNIVVASPDNIEKTITLNNDTLVRRFRDSIKASDLKVSDFIVVIGAPNDNGQIQAKFIRVMPDPADMMGTTTLEASTTAK